MTTPRLLAFAGSARTEAWSKKVLAVAVQGAGSGGAEVTVLELREYPLPISDGDLEGRDGVPDNAPPAAEPDAGPPRLPHRLPRVQQLDHPAATESPATRSSTARSSRSAAASLGPEACC
jgi:NADPH-dependent FMN reductase